MAIVDEKILYQSSGWKSIGCIGRFAEMHHIFNQNSQILLNAISIVQDVNRPDKIKSKIFIDDLNTYVFNFISSAAALRDNARKLLKKYDDTDFGNLLNNYIKTNLSNCLEGSFIFKYRNIHTHSNLVSLYFTDDDKVVWITEELLKISDEWNTKFKKYMQDSGQYIYLDNLFKTYISQINSFYGWLYNELIKYHNKDILQTIDIAEKLRIRLPNIYYKVANASKINL